ncbi:Crp/Fnr family transcriptional regulator [Photobacterium lipolyticum]|uniref:Crp/Fnr family transcriptional regulator n=1 Tax=Photobacterium lipolyticum TaxID=266810 RepID=A0A2T3N4Y0_9GAMM|nr:Crp/Fnr family transcriptional regulator [Photobacterium lipolyticum]PSW07526.1 Crp/Fnr family transcriptional regulator [Photobacterium lipolyticum]
MQLSPYASTRFTPYLEQHYRDFCDTLYACQTHTQHYQAGDIILKQGQDIEALYVVSVGKVSMNICALNGRRFQLGEVNCDHHVFGEMEFFTGHKCQWNVVADDSMEVEVICAKKLQQCLIEQPHLSLFFTSALACDYQESMDIYTNRLLHPIAYNIAYDLWQRQQTCVTLGAFDKVEQEAERFGTSSRVYRRAVKTLIDQGFIEKNNNQITIIDRCGLERFIAIHEGN